MEEILDLFEAFDTDTLSVKDFGITTNGTLVTHIHKNGDEVEVWSGDFDNDKYAEQLILSKDERDRIFKEIWDLL